MLFLNTFYALFLFQYIINCFPYNAAFVSMSSSTNISFESLYFELLLISGSVFSFLRTTQRSSKSYALHASCLMLTPWFNVNFSFVEVPTPRWGHSFSKTDERTAVIIGGQGIKNQISKDPIWQYDFCEYCSFVSHNGFESLYAFMST